MISGVFYRLLACLTVFSFSIYSYLDKQNSCTELKMHLPRADKRDPSDPRGQCQSPVPDRVF